MNILVNSRMRKKQKDIVKHGKCPEDYKIVLELYENDIRYKIQKDLKEGFPCTIFITCLVIYLPYMIFAGVFSFKSTLVLLLLILCFSLFLIIPIVILILILDRTSNFINCLFSAKYFDDKNKNADINNYHTWIKVDEHGESAPWSDKVDISWLVEDFKCSVCGKKAEVEHQP